MYMQGWGTEGEKENITHKVAIDRGWRPRVSLQEQRLRETLTGGQDSNDDIT